jgi:hypothetical protein
MAALKLKPKKTKRQPGAWLGEVVAWCPGSMTTPTIKQSKPHCPVCGKQFHWYELVDQLQGVPEH